MAPIEAVLVRQRDRSTWSPDAVREVRFGPRWLVTDHPVEDGSPVSDHVQRQPETITLSCVITANRVQPRSGGRAYLRSQVAWLRETAQAGDRVAVVTQRLGVFRDYVLTSVPHVIDGVQRLAFELELREVVVASATTVQISIETVAPDVATGAPDEVDAGEQGTTTTEDDPDAAESDSSILYDLIYGESQPEGTT